jgi:hypothetical protein
MAVETCFATDRVSDMLVHITDVLPKSKNGVLVFHDEIGLLARITREMAKEEVLQVAGEKFSFHLSGSFRVTYSPQSS